MKSVFTLTFLLLFTSVFATEINYTVSMKNPHTHYFNVNLEVKGINKDSFDIKMPVWAPGSYLVREFSKNIENLKTHNDIKIKQLNKNTWRVFSNKAKQVKITYDVYAFEISVRTSFLDASHGYINGTSLFFYIDGLINHPYQLTIIPHHNFKKITTALPKSKKGLFTYEAPNYDVFVDCPIEIGNHELFEFDAAGVKHYVAIYGDGNYNIDSLKVDMAKIVTAATNVFGENPNKEYTFIIHNLTKGSGGLEHANSTTLQVNRWTYKGSSYLGFLSLVAHEYFHLWNVKRIRPDVLGPFDYNNENYTDLLWVMEGFTSYYDELLLYRAGFYNKDKIIRKFTSSINSIENQPGNKVQSVADASFNAWIKAYRPNENSYNTTISYYTKGSVIANMLDLLIIDATDGQKNLDHVMQHLYKVYYKKENRGFNNKEMQQTIEFIAGKSFDDFFKNHIYDTKTIDYSSVFKLANATVLTSTSSNPYMGISTSDNKVKRVISNSSAYLGGLNVKDEIIAINNYRVTNDNINFHINKLKVNDMVDVLISRDNKIKSLTFPILASNKISYSIFIEKENLVSKKWLSK